jgi:type I restriction enzyme S subunit
MGPLATTLEYEEYKDSGVVWLGNIPCGWSIKKIYHLFKIGRGRVISQQELVDDGAYPVYSSQTKNNGILGYIQTYDFDCEQVTWTTDGANAGTVFLRKGKHNCTNVCGTLKPFSNSNIDLAFASYALSDITRFYKRPDTNGAKIMNNEMAHVKLMVPSYEEQLSISRFLDQKTTQIDEAIAIKEKQITLLKERKQIIIQKAVTQGLDPNVPMKNSGVEWIGEIPEHWEVRRSKFLFNQRKERAWKNDVQLSATQKYGVIPQEQYEALSGSTVVKIQFHLDKRKHVERDDFVISMRSFQGGLERAWSRGCIRSSYIILKALEEVSPDFYGYLFKLPKYIKALQRTASFIRDGQDLNFNNYSQVDLFIPPLKEQIEIANYIKGFMDSSDKGVILLEAQINKLKEYKTTLINSAVTGKIKVA